MKAIITKPEITTTEYNGKTYRYLRATIIKGASTWEVVRRLTYTAGTVGDKLKDTVEVTKKVSGKRTALQYPIGKVFLGWSEVINHYSSVPKEVWMDLASEFEVITKLERMAT